MVLGINAGRATQDLDIGVCVESLQEYKVFRDALCSNGNFKPNSHIDHRLDHSNGLWIDIIPFGRFAEPCEMYHWGEDDAFVMNVMGFSDAYSTSESVRINDDFEFKCAGYSEQFVLKLLAWKERHSIRGVDDARDLSFFLENAINTISTDELYGDETQAVLEGNGFDVELTSCFILGKRIRSVFSQRTCSTILEILSVETKDTDESELIADMFPYFRSWNHPEVRISDILRQVRNGLLT
jgi:predicted nucleotidyltransferase